MTMNRPRFKLPVAEAVAVPPRPPRFHISEEVMTEQEMLERDALRWRTLMSCQRIRILGTVEPRYHSETRSETRYLNAEFWSYAPDYNHRLTRPVLEQFVDLVIADQSAV